MENKFIITALINRFNDGIVEVDEKSDLLTVIVGKEIIHDVIAFLRNEPLNFGFLTDICGIHYPNSVLPLGVIYHLHNFYENKRIRIKTFVSLDRPEVSTMTDLFAGANWMERETYDFYGILFAGHPNLKRILNVDYMDYFPMRKEFPLEDRTREDKDDRFFGR